MAAKWATCLVTQAGPAEDGTIFIALKDAGGTFNCWFSAVPAMKKEMLATALSAISTGKSVNAYVTDTVAYSVINRLYLIA
jgi:hypothetical protein